MTLLKEYHYIWLKNHPKRTELWLRDALKEGFDIHHIDGNHNNNQPNNLVLIECKDHLMLHNNSKLCRLTKTSYGWSKSQDYKRHDGHVKKWQKYHQLINKEKIKKKIGIYSTKVKLHDEHVIEWIFNMWEEVHKRKKYI